MAIALDAILDRLGVARPTLDLPGLSRVYAAWCDRVPFDNVQKLLHLEERREGPLPGSSSEEFFRQWLEHRTGGTCWAGNGALHDLLAALGFEVQRVAATMMASPDTPPSNHGSVVATVRGRRYVVDASILSRVPLPLAHSEEPALPRIELGPDGKLGIIWRTFRAPEGFRCRIDRIGLAAPEFDALHQRTARWGPFNDSVTARVNRGPRSIGYQGAQRHELGPEGLRSEPRDRSGRDRFLVDELGMTASLIARLPEDRPMPPAPANLGS